MDIAITTQYYGALPGSNFGWSSICVRGVGDYCLRHITPTQSLDGLWVGGGNEGLIIKFSNVQYKLHNIGQLQLSGQIY